MVGRSYGRPAGPADRSLAVAFGQIERQGAEVDDADVAMVPTRRGEVFVRREGAGPPVLLLHGFPQTHLMWREVAAALAADFTVVSADLPGYGRSSCPPSDADHLAYSKRSLAADLAEVMGALGFERFSVVGHDRGGRVAYRAALDHPGRVDRLAVLDVLPIDVLWQRADDRLALAFWPWSLLAQAAPLPERLLRADPAAVLDHALGGACGTPAGTFSDEVRAAYLAALQDPDHLHAICKEYRAAASVDREHDAADRRGRHRITRPLLVLWSGQGPLTTWYADAGGPLPLWREVADDVRGRAVDGGHFFPEEHPAQTATELRRFLAPSTLSSR